MRLDNPIALKAFKSAAASYTRAATRSRKAARAALVRGGIYTRAGKLSLRYK